ncbi:DUF5801 repeats-in-toxin domain-containing protein, partial [Pseudomonas sp. N040]|uniref:DUF5801 repeats-in-toxin domain-containing protein n=1 Tax=Pseudomonas sp. N040 TaxID=2785325 RepID=UPI0035BE24ED|nr:hypothetical protein [Pseudomonas sp. N040]
MAETSALKLGEVQLLSGTGSGATLTATGEDTTLDETSGLQDLTATPGVAEDANDNDIETSALPAAFSTLLGVGQLNIGTPVSAALSGYTGAPGDTGSDAFSITAEPGGAITDIAFTDSSGAALNGQDSGLNTLDGTDILLYTYSGNNNLLLGRAGGSSGAIVFAAYIEETATGGKIWTVLYQPIQHPDGSDPDDALDLTDKVWVSASQDLQFSLANAPSGQNLFLMFTSATPTVEEVNGVMRISGPTIIATGKDPANQSSGVNITTGDTINTSQAGGPTTFGTNNQMIVEQEGIRFSYVTGARADVTIPNLDQNEADVESNIDFTGLFGARSATFDVVQLQSGKSAQVKITAFNTSLESGAAFIDGYAGDATVAITGVRVIDIASGTVLENSDGSANDPGIVISLVSGVATITGVKAGYKIEFTTTADHNRVLIENGAATNAKGNNHADFDIGGFKLLSVSTSSLEIGSQMLFEDDGPSVSVSAVAPADELTVDESDLTADDSANYADNFSSSSAYGTDGAGTLDSDYALSVKSEGVDSGLVDVATDEKVLLTVNGSGVVEGRTETSDDLVFTVSVDGSGTVSLDQLRALKHPDGTDPDDSLTLSAADLIRLTRTDTI